MTLVVAGVFVVLFGLSLAVMFFEWAHKSIASLVGVKEKYELLTFLGICKGGVLLLWQALSSHKRARAMEDAAQAQAAAAQAQAAATRGQARSIEATEQGQRQERLKNAIEHLGHDSVSVRLGGAYELFHLAEDTEALRKTALDILCAHIRRTTGEDKYQEKYNAKPSEEVQSLLTLLFVQDHQVFKGLQANLQGSFLNGADLKEAHLPMANLMRARLRKAIFNVADLRDANLWGAHLPRATFIGAHLPGAVFGKAHLPRADFSEAHLPGANLWEAHLPEASLWRAYLPGADLSHAHLPGADFSRAHLQAAELVCADLRGAGKDNWAAIKLFADHMNELIGKESDLSEVVFEGGLSREDVDSLVKDLSDAKANELRSKLEPHVGRPKVLGVPENCGARLDAYSKEEAEQWIAEYNKAMSEVPEKQ